MTTCYIGPLSDNDKLDFTINIAPADCIESIVYETLKDAEDNIKQLKDSYTLGVQIVSSEPVSDELLAEYAKGINKYMRELTSKANVKVITSNEDEIDKISKIFSL
jgi:hypothetical protein